MATRKVRIDKAALDLGPIRENCTISDYLNQIKDHVNEYIQRWGDRCVQETLALRERHFEDQAKLLRLAIDRNRGEIRKGENSRADFSLLIVLGSKKGTTFNCSVLFNQESCLVGRSTSKRYKEGISLSADDEVSSAHGKFIASFHAANSEAVKEGKNAQEEKEETENKENQNSNESSQGETRRLRLCYVDCNSTNGSFINEQVNKSSIKKETSTQEQKPVPVEPNIEIEIHVGDFIRFGQTTVKVLGINFSER